MNDKTDHLKQLGSNITKYSYSKPSPEIIETFPNKYPHKKYTIQLVFPEFTSLCPKTGQPDFATIIVEYIPQLKCIESKSFKLYMFSYRNYGSFMETITNKILEDLASACDPLWMEVEAKFNVRGGTSINVTAIHTKSND